MYWQKPTGGWFSAALVSNTSAQYLAQFQVQPWWVVSASPSVNSTLLGFNEKVAAVKPANIFSLLTTPNKTSNFLGKFEKRIFMNTNFKNFSQSTYQLVPWVNLTRERTAESLDSYISTQIKEVIKLLRVKDKGILLKTANTDADRLALAAFFAEISAEILPVVPQGGIYFEKLDIVKKIIDVTLATGKDIRIDRSSGFPNQGFRQLLQMSQLANGFCMFSPRLLFTDYTSTKRELKYIDHSEHQSKFLSFNSILFISQVYAKHSKHGFRPPYRVFPWSYSVPIRRLLLAPNFRNHSCQRKRRSSFDHDADEWLENLDLLSRTLCPFLHPSRSLLGHLFDCGIRSEIGYVCENRNGRLVAHVLYLGSHSSRLGVFLWCFVQKEQNHSGYVQEIFFC